MMAQEDPFSDIYSVAPIYDRMLRGETIRRTDPGFDILLEDFHRALVYSQRIGSSTDYGEVRSLISEMTGSVLDDSVTIVPPDQVRPRKVQQVREECVRERRRGVP